MKKTAKTLDPVHYFLLSNLLVIRFLRPIFSIFSIFSFRLWIDWLLLIVSAARVKSLANIRKSTIVLIGFVLSIFILNFIEHGVNAAGLQEALNLVLLLGIPLFYATWAKEATNFSQKRKTLLILLNVYFFINIIFVFLQIAGWFPVHQAFLAINGSAFDHYSGLIGLNGVQTLNFLWIATIFGNLMIGLTEKKTSSFLLVIMQLILVTIASNLNDNKMFIPVVLITLLVFMSVNGKYFPKFVFPLVLSVLMIGPWIFEKIISTFLSETGKSFDLIYTCFYDPLLEPNPHNERAFLNYLAFKVYNANTTGIGLSNANSLALHIHEHIGINSASLVLIQGGIPLLAASAVILFIGFRAIIGRSNLIVTATVIIFSVVLLYATNPLEDRYTLIAVCLLFVLILPVNSNEIGTIKKGELTSNGSFNAQTLQT